jgi:hypothetical protein
MLDNRIEERDMAGERIIPGTNGVRLSESGRSSKATGNKYPNSLQVNNQRAPQGTKFDVDLNGGKDQVSFGTNPTKATQDAEGNLDLKFPGKQSAQVSKDSDQVTTPGRGFNYQPGKGDESGTWRDMRTKKPVPQSPE